MTCSDISQLDSKCRIPIGKIFFIMFLSRGIMYYMYYLLQVVHPFRPRATDLQLSPCHCIHCINFILDAMANILLMIYQAIRADRIAIYYIFFVIVVLQIYVILQIVHLHIVDRRDDKEGYSVERKPNILSKNDSASIKLYMQDLMIGE